MDIEFKKLNNIHTTGETLNKLLDELKNNRPFCFTRYGDSQLMALEHWIGQDWEQTVTPKLRELLRKSIEVDDSAYLIAPACGYELEPGMEKKGTFSLYRNNDDLVDATLKYATTKEFWHCEAIHYGMLYNQEVTKELFKEINKKKVLVVAGDELDVKEWFPGDYIFIPMANAFSGWEEILQKIDKYSPDIILFSCGLTSQVLQYFMFLDKPNITTINMGSVFNALLEIITALHGRGWIKQNIDKIQQFKKFLNE